MKKLLAVLMAVAMLLSFAACGGDKEEETTVPEETTVEDVAGGEAIVDGEDETEEEITEVVTDESGETVTDESGEAVTEVVTEKEKATKKDETTKKADSNKSTKPAATKAETKPVSQWSKQEILDFYNKAVKAADAAPDSQKLHGNSVMKIKPGTSITADGGLGSVLKVVSPIAESALERNSSSTSNVPGYGEIKLSDLKSISATESGGKIVVKMTVKEQTDGPSADGSAGPVGRAIGTLGDIQGALNELGAEFIRGRETVTLTYTDVYINATLDKNTGKLVGGTYHYVVNILVKDAQIKISVISPNVKNLKAYIDYTVTF